MQLVGRERAVRCGQLLDCRQRHHCCLQSLSCRCVLSVGLLVVERQRDVRARQLLDCWQRLERRMHCLSCGDVQREQFINVVGRVLGVSCGRVLYSGMQLVGRERAVRGGQLLDNGQRPQRVVHAVSWWEILSRRLWKQGRQRALRCRQLLSSR